MITKERIKAYAKLAIRKGVNVQKGQILIINASLHASEMTRACVQEAYEAGASEVVVNYVDEYINRYAYMYQDESTLSKIRQFSIDSRLDYLKEGACILHIISEVPGIYKDVDPKKIGIRQLAQSRARKEISDYTMMNKTQWCIVAVPNAEWAMQVFGDCEDEGAAVELLWEEILNAVHVLEENDPIQEWNDLATRFTSRSTLLNTYDFESLHFTNKLGTDLHVGLVQHHVWTGGSDTTIGTEIEFNPNMPTEEIFTMPEKTGVNGVVYASRPLLYNGTLIENFWLRFKDGQVVEYDAETGGDALAQLIHFDEGSSYLGEVALVPYDSPISQSNILFLNTLFDENASCHLALGDAYPTSVQGGSSMSEEELGKAGANHSMTHIDFMFGTQDLHVVGKTKDGQEIEVFQQGNFTF